MPSDGVQIVIMVGPALTDCVGYTAQVVKNLVERRATTGGWSMRSTIRYVGLDVHKDTVTIAVARGQAEPQVVGTVANG